MAGAASPVSEWPVEAAFALRAALAAVPAVAGLPSSATPELLGQVEAACRGYLADRAVAPGTRSGDVADRLERAAVAARALTGAVEALDGVGWGLVGRRLRDAAGFGGEGAPPADIQTLLACVRRVDSALEEAADTARREPQVGLDRARLRLAANVGAALDRAGVPLAPEPAGPFAACVRAALAAVGLELPADPEVLLARAAKVARREQGISARA